MSNERLSKKVEAENSKARDRNARYADRIAELVGIDPERIWISGRDGVLLTPSVASDVIDKLESLIALRDSEGTE